MKQSTNKQCSNFADFERRGWDELSSAYAENWGHVTSAFVPAILADIHELEGKRLLDVATGPGYAAELAHQKGAIVTGIDFCAQMVAEAQQSYPHITFMIADVESLPFESEAIEVCISNFGLQHFSNPQAALSEIWRVLNRGGTLSFTVWAEGQQNAASSILENALNRFALSPCTIPEGPDYGFLWEADHLHNTLINSGYAAETISTKLQIIPWQLKDPDELFRAEIAGSVRSGARLRQEGDESIQSIRTAMSQDILANYCIDDVPVIPMAAYIISVRKP